MDGEKKISWIIQFIRKYLKLEQNDSLFLYVNQAFSPSPDQTVSNLLVDKYLFDKYILDIYLTNYAWHVFDKLYLQVSNLNECFGSADNKLVLYYSRSECWG